MSGSDAIEELERLIAERSGVDWAWVEHAACRGLDPELFFPEGSVSNDVKAICQSCPVRTECLEAGIAGKERGVWGGTSARERRRIRIERGLGAA